ncbi:hypothetical protein B0H19DRAFT_1138220 [Mycena capillaripes]|nr:hypothetical protein B0H19DRAFT_1138220 [Mycena capillaripes]
MGQPVHHPPRPHSMAHKQLRFGQTVDEIEEHRIADPASEEQSNAILHPALRPNECPALDFSLPSSVFRAEAHLSPVLLSKPACSPPRSSVKIRVPSTDGQRGLCTFDVVHVPKGEPVTVGDVLSAIRDKLRQPEKIADQDVHWYHAQRVHTLDAYCASLDAATRSETKCKEVDTKTRRVDRLCGKVLFAGITFSAAEPDKWHLNLEFSDRYKD